MVRKKDKVSFRNNSKQSSPSKQMEFAIQQQYAKRNVNTKTTEVKENNRTANQNQANKIQPKWHSETERMNQTRQNQNQDKGNQLHRHES